MFPVQDFQGRTVAFGGRVMPESHGGPPDKSAPKYINSPETNIFHKGKLLYGLSRARKSIGDGEIVVVVEGYMDVIALAQAGFRAAVAPLGTALTESQIEELWKVMPEGKRHPVLDMLFRIYDLLHNVSCGRPDSAERSALREQAVHHKREFISRVQAEVDPRRRVSFLGKVAP